MKYTVGQQVWFKSLAQQNLDREYYGTIIGINGRTYQVKSGLYTRTVFENEIIKLKE